MWDAQRTVPAFIMDIKLANFSTTLTASNPIVFPPQLNVEVTIGVDLKENPLYTHVLQIVDTAEGVLNIGPKKESLVCLCAEISSKQ